MVYYFFIHLSLSSLFTLFISLVSHSSLDIKLHSFLLSLFFLLNLVVFLSSSQTSPSVFSSHSFLLSLLSLSQWFFFFFFWVVIWYSVWQWVGWDGDWRITGGGLRWSNSMVGESVGGGDSGWVCGMRWWWVLLCEISCGRTGLWMGSEVWVVGGWVGSDNGWVCGMRWVGGWRRLCFDFGVFFFFFK